MAFADKISEVSRSVATWWRHAGYQLIGCIPRPCAHTVLGRRFFRRLVLRIREVLRQKQGEASDTQAALERKLRELRSNRDKLDQAFIYQKAIDLETYQRMRTALLSDITLADMELREASLETIDAEELVEFALNVLVNASNLWKTATLEQKQRFQQVLFPEGVEYTDGDYRTTATCMLFNGLETEEAEKEELVALPGIEPGFED